MTKVSTRRRELFGIQMLRGLAAFAVLVHHALETSNGLPAAQRITPEWLITSGAAGVDIFFVISGFIMIYVGFRGEDEPVRPGAFLRHRVIRIYPLYWICCLGILAIHAVGFLQNMTITPDSLIRSALLLPNGHHVLGVAWTLVYEMYFYLLFAATLFLRSRSMAVIVSSILLVIGIAIAGLAPDAELRTFLSNPIVFEFALGMGLALLFVRDRLPNIPLWAGLAGQALLFLAPLYVAHEGTSGLPGWPRVFAWGLPSALMVASVLSLDAPKTVFGRAAVLLGDASYALYLTHVYVVVGYGFVVSRGTLDGTHQVVSVAAVVLVSIALALFTHLVIEMPLTRMLRKKRTGKTTGPARSQAPSADPGRAKQ